MKLTTLCFLILVFIGYSNVFATSPCLKPGCNGESAISGKFVCQGFTCEQDVCKGTCSIKNSTKFFQGNFNIVCQNGVCSIDSTNKFRMKTLKPSVPGGNSLESQFPHPTDNLLKKQYVNVFFLIDATASMRIEPSPFDIATEIATKIATKIATELKNKFKKTLRFGFLIYRDEFALDYSNMDKCNDDGICLYYPLNELGDFTKKLNDANKNENNRHQETTKLEEGDGYEEQLFLGFEKTLEEMGKNADQNDLNFVIVIADHGDKKGILSSKMCDLTQKMTNLLPFFIQTPYKSNVIHGDLQDYKEKLYKRAYARYKIHAKTLIKLVLRNKFKPEEVGKYLLELNKEDVTVNNLANNIATTVATTAVKKFENKTPPENSVPFFKDYKLLKGWLPSNYHDENTGLLNTSIHWKKSCLNRSRNKQKRLFSPITGIGVVLHPNIKSVRTQTWNEIWDEKSTTEMKHKNKIVRISVIPYIVQSQEKFMLIPNTPEFNAFMPACTPGFAGLGKEILGKPYQYPTVILTVTVDNKVTVDNPKIRENLVDFLKNQRQKDSCWFEEFTEAPVDVAKTDQFIKLLDIFKKVFEQKQAVFLKPFPSKVTIKLWESEKITKDSEKIPEFTFKNTP
jgi:hypothetical protein